jgi:hypothetical protein
LPVGIEDALWFAFQNDKILVDRVGSYEELPMSAFTDRNNLVFDFQSDGSLRRVINTKDGYKISDE